MGKGALRVRVRVWVARLLVELLLGGEDVRVEGGVQLLVREVDQQLVRVRVRVRVKVGAEW